MFKMDINSHALQGAYIPVRVQYNYFEFNHFIKVRFENFIYMV